MARLSYLADYQFWIVVETPRNRSKLDRNWFLPVCGHRPVHFWLGFVRFGGRFGSQIDDFGQILEQFWGPFLLSRVDDDTCLHGASACHGEHRHSSLHHVELFVVCWAGSQGCKWRLVPAGEVVGGRVTMLLMTLDRRRPKGPDLRMERMPQESFRWARPLWSLPYLESVFVLCWALFS